MEKIKRLLAEYEIRFGETKRISKPSFFNSEDLMNKQNYAPQINEKRISNENGVVYQNGVWEIAKLTKKPEKWVVERDENHPIWKEFEEWMGGSGLFLHHAEGTFKYYGNNGAYAKDLILYFKDHQYLTLDQWAEFYLPKVDFSIHNLTDWFYIKIKTPTVQEWLSKGPLTEKGSISFNLNNGNLFNIGLPLIIKTDAIIEFRKPTDEELNILYEKHPKYAPPKEGDWGVFWDRKESTIYISSLRSIINEKKLYADAYGSCWHHFTPFSPELQEMLKKEIDNI
ncbi:MAG: hypothetical protein RBT61_00560 [Candidatus Kapabacteria bacterium]|jgi:hypothetical protein|nr:hypothetical protein [Candidatus Kapabacteria bacterium]